MNKIIVYEYEDFNGLSKEFISDVPDLRSVDFGDCISSLKVIGQPWLAFQNPNYKGLPAAFEEGEYKRIPLNNQISSLQLVTEDLENPQITLYENAKYEGASKVITEETNLTYGYFNNKASSHIVQKGAWLLYEKAYRSGWLCIAREGTKNPDYGSIFNFHDKCSHVYPLKAGRPVITTKILWDRKKVESESEVVIDEFIGINATDFEQTFNSSNSRVYETATSHSFKFTPNLQIDEKFTLSIDPSTTLTVEKGKPESIHTIDKVKVIVPVKIPPHSELNVQVIKKLVTASAPVEVSITRNGKTKTEIGEYRTVSGRSINARYAVKPIEIKKKT
ncbi:epidermal differentiation-specific protein-like [Sceloporus undulatus]|uniref:epidermal differentiation-specific protein-like n=1 Tax=Sceloporus undulatus TaxID=8520 RepID=UPI001C4AED4F|nr:epidermal differentiation-specific protein-like [Sceloporus undulatus]